MSRLSSVRLPLAAFVSVLWVSSASPAKAQRVVVAPESGFSVPVVVPGSTLRGPAQPLSTDALSRNLLRTQSLVSQLESAGFDTQKALLDRYYDNAIPAGIPLSAGPATGPGARAIPFKDATLPSYAFSEQTDISELLVQAIDKTESTLDIAIHGLSLKNVAEALLRAKERGVKIRIVMNHSHVYAERPDWRRSKEVQFLVDNGFDMRSLRGGGPYGVMHNKIAIFDGQLLKYGSFNWTQAAAQKNFENALFNGDPRKIGAYQNEYERLWNLGKPVSKGALDAWPLVVDPAPQSDGGTVDFNGQQLPAEIFSPNNGVQATIIRAIDAARVSIHIAMFNLNADPVVEALIRAKGRGVTVRVVVEKTQSGNKNGLSPDIQNLLKAGIDARWTRGHVPGGVMHNKFAVFDGKMLETGAYNWTNNAEFNNYENANFSTDARDVAAFEAEFEKIFQIGTTPAAVELADLSADAGAEPPASPLESAPSLR